MTFTVVRLPSAYNVILRRLGLNILNAVISIKCLLIHFPTKNGVNEMHGDQQLAWQCFLIASRMQKATEVPTTEQLD